jgi:hypothetical protein
LSAGGEGLVVAWHRDSRNKFDEGHTGFSRLLQRFDIDSTEPVGEFDEVTLRSCQAQGARG